MLRKNASQIYQRQYSTKNHKYYLSSQQIRESFIEYFTNTTIHKHTFVRSSPVVPFSDPTVAFVNAGMNQFKSIFLGKTNPIASRVVNSQKCIRVGGKHNDLSIVGQDGYHHTFFEMLGNWSFGDYYKKEACSMALDYLKGSLGIDENSLYFTYFAGDPKLNLPPDIECYDIWKSLGIKNDRILPFGSKENFWEMGTVGPCGPCTEIHIDHLSPNSNRSKFVNQGYSDLTELWNIVFIEHNRNIDGSITPLSQKHIDTGMGLERLCAIMQQKSSNYDTDLFTPIFDNIHKITKIEKYSGKFPYENTDHLDVAYRILADHSRMIIACLSDSMLPEQNQKLRRIMRKCFLISENIFKKDNLLVELIPIVGNILGPTYPEMLQKLNSTIEIIKYEQELFKMLRENSSKIFEEFKNNSKMKNFGEKFGENFDECAGFLPAYKELQQEKCKFINNQIPWQFLYKLYDTYGLNEELIIQLSQIENLNINLDELKTQMQLIKNKSKINVLPNEQATALNVKLLQLTANLLNTNDNFKYKYEFNRNTQQYESINIKANIIGIIQNTKILLPQDGDNVLVTNTEDMFYVITNITNFYYESGGQESDTGVMKFTNLENSNIVRFLVYDVQNINGNTVHRGKFVDANQKIQIFHNNNIELCVNSQRRSQNIYNHTATHLLNGAIRCLFPKNVIYQISSSVTRDRLKLDLGIIGNKIHRDDVSRIDKYIKNIIDADCSVKLSETNAANVLNSDITLIPGEIYPETGLRLITIEYPELEFLSKELCCGTHAHQTSHIKNFCLINFKQLNRTTYTLTAVTENIAEKAIELAKIYTIGVDKLEMELKLEQDKHLQVESELHKLKHSLLHGDILIPYGYKMNLIDRVNHMLQLLKEASRTELKEFVEIEMKTVLEQNMENQFIIHFLDSANLVKSVHLQKATKLCQDRPIMVISLNNGMVKARCCVPSNQINDNFNATNWLQIFANKFDAQISAPRGQNGHEICNMKAKKVIARLFEDQLEDAISHANKFANERM